MSTADSPGPKQARNRAQKLLFPPRWAVDEGLGTAWREITSRRVWAGLRWSCSFPGAKEGGRAPLASPEPNPNLFLFFLCLFLFFQFPPPTLPMEIPQSGLHPQAPAADPSPRPPTTSKASAPSGFPLPSSRTATPKRHLFPQKQPPWATPPGFASLPPPVAEGQPRPAALTHALRVELHRRHLLQRDVPGGAIPAPAEAAEGGGGHGLAGMSRAEQSRAGPGQARSRRQSREMAAGLGALWWAGGGGGRARHGGALRGAEGGRPSEGTKHGPRGEQPGRLGSAEPPLWLPGTEGW